MEKKVVKSRNSFSLRNITERHFFCKPLLAISLQYKCTCPLFSGTCGAVLSFVLEVVVRLLCLSGAVHGYHYHILNYHMDRFSQFTIFEAL
jgi:hypothetical protein